MQAHMSIRLGAAVALGLLICSGAAAQPEAPAEADRSAPLFMHDPGQLPAPVAATRAAIMEAARTGQIEALRPVLEANELMPLFTFGGERDPIAYWQDMSRDGAGREVLAAMLDILEMDFVRLNPGAADEMYVWPFLAVLPLDDLTPADEVALYRLVSPDDAMLMREFGGYVWYRLGIGPDGTWHYFLAGD